MSHTPSSQTMQATVCLDDTVTFNIWKQHNRQTQLVNHNRVRTRTIICFFLCSVYIVTDILINFMSSSLQLMLLQFALLLTSYP